MVCRFTVISCHFVFSSSFYVQFVFILCLFIFSSCHFIILFVKIQCHFNFDTCQSSINCQPTINQLHVMDSRVLSLWQAEIARLKVGNSRSYNWPGTCAAPPADVSAQIRFVAGLALLLAQAHWAQVVEQGSMLWEAASPMARWLQRQICM